MKSVRFARRGSRALALFAASTVAVMAIGSVFAMLSDSATVDGAYAESNDWNGTTATGSVDMRIKSTACDPLDDINDTNVFRDDAVVSLVNAPGSLDLDVAAEAPPGMWTSTTPILLGEICVANVGADPGQLLTSVLSSFSYELDDCQAAEESAETSLGLASCLVGDFGELDQVTSTVIEPTCTSYGSFGLALALPGQQVELVPALQPNATCNVTIELHSQDFLHTTSTDLDPQLLMALSDSVGFDLAFDLLAN